MQDKVLQSFKELPLQFEQAFNETLSLPYSNEYKKAREILVCGMGGSRFPALIVYHLFKDYLKVPVLVNDEYRFPKWVNENTLVILSSYSGTTEEVLFNSEDAFKRTDLVTAITSGGKLAEIMRGKRRVFYQFNPVHNPSEQPRMGVGYAVGGLIGLFLNLGLLDYDKEKIEKSLEDFKTYVNDFVSGKDHLAEVLTKRVYERIPFYVVAEFLEGLGKALANQTNETAKSISSYHVIPELNHHLMEGLKHPEAFKKIALFVFFNSSLYHPRVQKRFKITKEVVEKNEVETFWVDLKGDNILSQAFYFLSLSTYFTYLLSQKYKEEPDKIPFVDYFKKRLKEDE